MTVKFYTITDDPRVVDKTVSSAVLTLTGVHVKGECSTLEPEFELAYNSSLMTCNYMYVEEWGLYYFIRDRKVSAQRMILITKEDVLMCYSSGLKSCKAIIRRQEKTGPGSKTNLYLQDKAFVTKAYNNPTVHLFRQPDGKISQFTKADMSFVMALAGAGI